jgi:DNA helicase HerA-like ATPase
MREEKQGSWFLGGTVGSDDESTPVEYESARLTTHGVIVGMTGSGKTGLGIIALEEALLDGIPCLVIDPKGDMGNLLLNFPSFAAEDFLPWIDEGQAKCEGVTPESLAASTADMWKNGLAGWEIGSDRMRALGTGAGFTIYTPGSTAGVPLNMLG